MCIGVRPARARAAPDGVVEHEVSEVTSGHRVTITYNLYFDATKGAPLTQYNCELEHPFQVELRKVKENPELRRKHRVLGFGLEHAYPFRSAILEPSSILLKGNDAILVRILAALNITHTFFLLYRKDEGTTCPFRLLSDHVVHEDQDWTECERSFERITGEGRAWLVWNKQRENNSHVPRPPSSWCFDRLRGKEIPSLKVDWVTAPAEEYLDKSITLAYGNEPRLDFFYHQLCVVATFDNDFEGEK